MEFLNKDNKFIEPKLEVKKPLTGKAFYKKRLMEVLGRTFWQVNGVSVYWTEEMLADSLRFCESYQSIKARNYFFNQYAADTRKSGKTT